MTSRLAMKVVAIRLRDQVADSRRAPGCLIQSAYRHVQASAFSLVGSAAIDVALRWRIEEARKIDLIGIIFRPANPENRRIETLQ